MKPLKLQYRSELIAQLKEEGSQIAAEKYVYNKLRFFYFLCLQEDIMAYYFYRPSKWKLPWSPFTSLKSN